MAIDFKESYPIISWDLNKRNLFFKYFGKKSDSARGFKVQILQDQILLIPSTETLRFYCVKSDGAKVYIDAVIDDAYFIINLTNQVFAVKGLVSCELQLNSGGEWLTSDTFGITVSDNLMDGSIVSSNDFIALQNALSRIDRALTTDNIVNNTVTTVEGTVLDGRMGKNIQDQVATINNNLGNITNKYVKGSVAADTTLKLTLDERSAYILNLISTQTTYTGAFILVLFSSTTAAEVMTIKSATNVTVEADIGSIKITSNIYSATYALTKLS